MRKIKFVVILLSLVLLAGVGATPAVVGTGHAPLPPDFFPVSGPVDGDHLKVGDIVAVGNKTGDGVCEMGSIEIRRTAPGDGNTTWLAIQLDALCQAVVVADWQGLLEEGPAGVVGPLQRLLQTASSPVPVRIEAEQSPAVPKEDQVQDVVFKKSEQQVYMYGYGGEADKLTRLQSWINFAYDGVSAQITDEGGWCQGSNPVPGVYEWVVDNCWGVSYRGPASRVNFEQHGDYHCDPTGRFPCNLSNPDGYFHTLHSNIDGHGDGTSHCTYGYSGQIVAGVDRTILQGCN